MFLAPSFFSLSLTFIFPSLLGGMSNEQVTLSGKGVCTAQLATWYTWYGDKFGVSETLFTFILISRYVG